MANGVGVETGIVLRESSVSTVKIRLAEATAALQRTAAALMAAQSGDGFQKVMPSVSAPIATSGPPRAASTAAAGDGLRPALASKAGISFVIPKNKLSGALVPVVRNLGGKWESSSEPQKADEEVKTLPQRKTRWGFDRTQDPAVKRGRALALQTRAEQIAAQLESGHLDIDTAKVNRSPSPPPIYDVNGQRTNTREVRRREQLELERREAIGECMQLNPSYKPPAGYKPVYKEAKLYIPVKDYPGYNFIGLILGPRGNTQKRMEAETGSKIAIRGKGAIKEGKSNAIQGGRRNGKEAEGAFEELHVHITADSIEKVDAAVALIEPLLTPVDGKVLDKEYLNFLEELGDGLAGANAGSTLVTSSKSPAKESVKAFAQAVTSSSATPAVGTSDMPENTLDPNQLADVIPGPQPMLITASGPQPPAWSSAGMFPGDARVGPPQEASLIQAEADRQFHSLSNDSRSPNVHPPLGASPFNSHPSLAFFHPSHPPTFGTPPMFHGQPPPSAVNAHQEGPIHAQRPLGQPGLQNSHEVGPGMFGQERALPVPESTFVGGHSSGNNKEQVSGMIPIQMPPHGPRVNPPDALHCQPNSAHQVSFPLPQLREATTPGPPPVTGRPPFVCSWPPPPSSSGTMNSWNPNFIPPQASGHGNFPTVWESGTPHGKLPPPPSAWKSGPAPQPPSSVWPLSSGPPWDRGGPSGTPAPGVQSTPQPPWELKQKPWEGIPLRPLLASQSPTSAPTVTPTRGTPGMGLANPPWKPAHLLPPPPPPPPLQLPPPPQPSNQPAPWTVPQAQNVRQSPLQSSRPSSGLGPAFWKGPPSSPLALPKLPSQPPAPSQSPQLVISSRASHLAQLFPPWHPQAQQPSRPGTLLNFGPPRVMSSGGNTPHPSGPWGQSLTGGPSPRPDPSVASHSDRGANQGQSYDPFSPTVRSPRLNSSNVHLQQVVGPKFVSSLPPGFGPMADISGRCHSGLPEPNGGRSQPGLPVGHPQWQTPQVMGLNPRPAPPVPSTPVAAQEVDAEYENLMASVGVT